MPEILGFRAHRFAEDVVGELSRVVTPPFDVISPEERATLAQLSPFNMVHLILPEPAGELDKYAVAEAHFNACLKAGVFRQDDADSFYLIEQHFCGPDGAAHVRRGFFAAVHIPEPGERVILDHERTFDTKVKDRLALMRATRANLGSVFGLYDDPQGALNPFLASMDVRPPDAEAQTIDGVRQRLWRVPADPAVTAFFANRLVYIADGHHRFRTACVYRDEQREAMKSGGPAVARSEFVLMGFVAFQDPGLEIWPAHRLLDPPEGFSLDAFLGEVAGCFAVTPETGDMAKALKEAPGCTIGVVAADGRQYLLTLDEGRRLDLLGPDRTPAWRALDVAVLHRGLLQRFLHLPERAELTYEPRTDRALAALRSGEKRLGFFLKGITPAQIRACAEAFDPMPEKATYFYPKLPSGMVIHRL